MASSVEHTTNEHIDTTHAHTHAANDDGHEHGGPKVYAGVLAALLFMTVVTVGASYIDFGAGKTNVIIAMLIASCKASLVALFFMHLRWDKPMSAIIFCCSLFFLGLFLIGSYTDYVARDPSEPSNIRSAVPPGGLVGPQQNQTAPQGGHAGPEGATPAGLNAPVVQGASPQGNAGGPSAGTEHPAPQVPTGGHEPAKH
jgi:cytochrome c oxidase subunit 4